MKRRRFLASTLALASLPRITAAQSPSKVFRVGWLIGGSADGSGLFLDALRAGLADHGYVEGQNLVIEKRYGDDGPEPVVAALANELARLPVDVLVTQGYATRTIVKEIKTVIANPAHSGAESELQACENAARQLGITIRQVLVRNPAELEESLAEVAAGKPGAITVLPDALVIQKRQRIVDFAAGERIPVISGWKIFAESGALCTYGPRLTESYRRAGYYIDRILKGMKPAELPIERPTVFELVVNLKSAKTLGVTVPPSVLARADEVIE